MELSRALLAYWVGTCSDLLTLLVDAIGYRVRTADKLHADDTLLPVLGLGLGKTKTARLGTMCVTTDPAACRTRRRCGLPPHQIAHGAH